MSEADTGSAAGRKRRWGSSTSVIAKKPSISITTDSLKVLARLGDWTQVSTPMGQSEATLKSKEICLYRFYFTSHVCRCSAVSDSGHQIEPGGGCGATPGGTAAVRGRGEPGRRSRRPGQRPQDPTHSHTGPGGLAASNQSRRNKGFLLS